MSLYIENECSRIHHKLIGLIDVHGNPIYEYNPLPVRSDWSDGWSLLDDQGAIVYYGFPIANPDSESDPICAIMKIETVGTITTRKWVDGTLTKLFSWSLRASYNYYFLK
jgi:hypothetical protein